MRKRQMTSIIILIALRGLLAVMIVVTIASFFLQGGDDSYDIETSAVILEFETSSDESAAARNDGLFTPPDSEIDFGSLVFHQSDVSISDVTKALEKNNQSIHGIELLVKAKILRPNLNPDLPVYHYQTYKITEDPPFILEERRLDYTDIDQSFWRINIFEDTIGRITISPKVTIGEDSKLQIQKNYMYDHWSSPYNSFKELTPQSFGRGINTQVMNLKKVYEVEGRSNLLMLEFQQFPGHYGYSFGSYPFSSPEYQNQIVVDKEKDYSWIYMKRIINKSRGFIGGGPFSLDHEISAQAFDYKKIDGVWIPHRLQYLGESDELSRDYTVVEVKSLGDGEFLSQRIQAMKTPKPGDSIGRKLPGWGIPQPTHVPNLTYPAGGMFNGMPQLGTPFPRPETPSETPTDSPSATPN